MIRVALLTCVLLVSACGTSPLSLLTGGGPKVAANGQAGKTNAQTIGQTTLTEQIVKAKTVETVEQSSGTTTVRTEQVERITVNQTDKWVLALLLLLAGFVIPSPREIARGVSEYLKSRVAKLKKPRFMKLLNKKSRDPRLARFVSTRDKG